MATSTRHKWIFSARFRRNAFGWKSQPAIKRVKEAVAEIKKVARKDKLLAANGAVLFLEKVSPALAHVDSSSGAIGTAVSNAVDTLSGIIASAPAEREVREEWLDRLFTAHGEDDIPYIELLADYWGDLCAGPELSSKWADELLSTTRKSFSRDPNLRGYFHGSSACLSALYAAKRYRELFELADSGSLWSDKQWAVKALVAQGKKSQAIAYAESCRSPWAMDQDIDRLCEEILLSSGLIEEAYRRYGLTANRKGTNLAWFRAVAKKYAGKPQPKILSDLVALVPGEEGKWFATAKSMGLYEQAIELASTSPCAPQTLARAARDFANTEPAYAVECGIAALRWLHAGHGYEVTNLDVLDAWAYTSAAAEKMGSLDQTTGRIRDLLRSGTGADDNFVTKLQASSLGLSGV